MDAIVVGLLTAITVALGTVYWYLLVRPDLLFALFGRDDLSESTWFTDHAATLRALRWSAGGVVFLCCFLTGLAIAFFAVTP